MSTPEQNPHGEAMGSVPVVVKVVDSGPLQVKGPVRLVDHDGHSYDIPSRRAVFLCRCGQSGSKPFCDGSHKRTGFTAADRAAKDAEADAPCG